MANEQELQAGFQPGSESNNLTRQPPQPTPPKAIFASPQPATPPAVIEQFPLYDPTAPATLQSVQPYQTGYTPAEYSRDVVVPPPKPSPIHSRRLIVGIVAAVVGVMVASGVVFSVWDDPYVYGPGWEDPPVVVAGEEVYAGWMEAGGDYSYQDLRDTDMSHFNLTATSFVGSDLRNAALTGATIVASDFSNVDARGADMSLVTAAAVTFKESDLRGAILSEATFQGANFSGADLRGANLVGTNFSGANLAGADLAGAIYDGATVWPTGFIVPANAVKI